MAVYNFDKVKDLIDAANLAILKLGQMGESEELEVGRETLAHRRDLIWITYNAVIIGKDYGYEGEDFDSLCNYLNGLITVYAVGYKRPITIR